MGGHRPVEPSTNHPHNTVHTDCMSYKVTYFLSLLRDLTVVPYSSSKLDRIQ